MRYSKSSLDAILLNQILDEPADVDRLPSNHPARVRADLDREILENASGFGVDVDTLRAVAAMREHEAAVRKDYLPANERARDEIDFYFDQALREEVENRNPFAGAEIDPHHSTGTDQEPVLRPRLIGRF